MLKKISTKIKSLLLAILYLVVGLASSWMMIKKEKQYTAALCGRDASGSAQRPLAIQKRSKTG